MLVNIDDAQPGMILAEDIMLPNGLVLVNSSHELTGSLIEMLRRRNIRTLQVLNPEAIPHQSESEEEAPTDTQKDSDVAKAHEPVEEEAAPVPPLITVTIADDLMAAHLRIDPQGAPNEVLAPDDIMRALQDKGVVYGIDPNKVQAAVEKWRTQKRTFEIDGIAKGALPAAGREGCMEMTALHLSSAAKCNEVKKATHYWQAAGDIGDAERVDANTVIAERQIDMPPVPGKTVTGECCKALKLSHRPAP